MSEFLSGEQHPLIHSLMSNGNFLALSRFQSDYFNQALSFSLKNKTKVSILAAGIISFEPELSGDKDIILSCGIHGNETAPIEICDDFVQHILQEKLTPAHRVLFIFGNLPAMNIGQRFIEENMNRLFSGAHSAAGKSKNSECLRAELLEQVVTNFYVNPQHERIHYDLHTAIKPSKNAKFAVYPFRHGRAWNKSQLSFLAYCGIKTILLSESPTTTFSYFSSNNFNAEAFTVELGKVQAFGQNNMADFADVKNALRLLIQGDKLPLKVFDNEDFLIYRVNQVINRQSEDFTFHFSDSLANFSDFPKDFLLATDGEIDYRCQFEGEAIVFPNANVALGQRAVLTVVPTAI